MKIPNLTNHQKKIGEAIINAPEVTPPLYQGKDSGQTPIGQHMEIVYAVQRRIGEENLIYYASSFWIWRNTGVWVPVNERELKKEIQEVLESGAFGLKFSRAVIDSVLDMMKNKCFRTENIFNTVKNCINTEECVIEWNNKLQQWEPREHRRDDYMTTQIPVKYDPNAECPRSISFLKEIFDGDADGCEKALALMEMIGYSLLTTCNYEKFIMLVGSGANGKSVILRIVEALVGANLVCGVQPSQLDNKFQRAHLQGKLVNIVTEIAEGAQIADAQLKAIVSGELTTAEHKHKSPFNFHPFCTCWFATNHLPHTRDFSNALTRRATILTLNNKFDGDRCDPLLAEKLLEELPGILNLALGSLRGVMIRGGFTAPDSSEIKKHEWQKDSDQAAQYFDDCLILDPNKEIGSSPLYENYKTWAIENGISLNRLLSQKSLIERLTSRYPISTSRTNKYRYLTGVTFKPTDPSIAKLPLYRYK